MRIIRLRQVAIKADDLDVAVAFYKDVLGATLMARFDPPGLAFFDFDGVRLLLEGNAPVSTIYFWVDDINAACSEIVAKGVSLDHAPHMIFKDDAGTFGPAGEGEWMAFFKDPAGNTLSFVSRKPA